MSAQDARAEAIAACRAAADLLESNPDIPVPTWNATFWADRGPGDATPAVITATLLATFAGPWKVTPQNYGSTDYLEITTGPVFESRVKVIVPAADAGREVGQRVVTDYELLPEIKALLGEPEAGQ